MMCMIGSYQFYYKTSLIIEVRGDEMSRTEALISLGLASLIVGSTLVVSRFISAGNSVFFIQFVSMSIAFLLLRKWIGKERLKYELKHAEKKDYIIFFFQTLTGVVCFRIFIVYGIRYTQAMDAGVILSLTPVMTVLLSVVFLKERLGKRHILAMLCAFVGVLIINLNGVHRSNQAQIHTFWGNLMVFLAVLGESAFVVFSKKASIAISPLTRSMLICLISVGLFFPLSIYEVLQDYSFLKTMDFWLLSTYYGVILTVTAYVLWFRAIPYVSGTTAGVFNSLIPVSAIGLVFLILGESMTLKQMGGFMFIFTGVGLIVFSKEKLRVAE